MFFPNVIDHSRIRFANVAFVSGIALRLDAVRWPGAPALIRWLVHVPSDHPSLSLGQRARSMRAVAGQSRAVRRERGGPRRLSARNLPARFSRSVGRESARVLQARGDAGDGAQDEVDESCLLALRELFLVHLLAQRPEGEHLGDGQRVHVWGADADGLAEHVTVLQRPLVAHDALKLVRSMALENHGECGCTGSLLDKVT